mmetsp:Transcript_42828/g.51983  ORF Transcript_42828/g.51983 Transcript_42828/m.51983 type:complete len:349 (-) Transcript_42828:777-1823(-)
MTGHHTHFQQVRALSKYHHQGHHNHQSISCTLKHRPAPRAQHCFMSRPLNNTALPLTSVKHGGRCARGRGARGSSVAARRQVIAMVGGSGMCDEDDSTGASLAAASETLLKQRIALVEFQDEMASPDDSISLIRAACLLAKHHDVSIDFHRDVQRPIDRITSRFKEKLYIELDIEEPSDLAPLRLIKEFNAVFYDEAGFKGCLPSNYYKAENSCMNRVLSQRTGIPITLSLVYMEALGAAGVPMRSVGLPGHFMVCPDVPGIGFMIDVFNGGEVLFIQDAEQRLQQIFRREVEIDRDFLDNHSLSNRDFIRRMVMNFANAHERVFDVDKLELLRPFAETVGIHLNIQS